MQTQFAYFSAAIRAGFNPQALNAQALGNYIHKGKVCPIGAGMMATGLDIHRVVERFPYLEKTYVSCPVCPFGSNLMGVMIHLNDDHKWERETIADWLFDEEEKIGFVTIDMELKPEVIWG